MIIWIFLAIVLAFIFWSDGYGSALCRESDFDCYEQNERFRVEEGKPPIPWRGSMQKYLKDCDYND